MERKVERKFVPRVTSEPGSGSDMGDLFGIDVEGKIFGNLPDKDLAIFGTGCDDVVVEGVPKMVGQMLVSG